MTGEHWNLLAAILCTISALLVTVAALTLAIILLIANCLGAAFTIRRNNLASKAAQQVGTGASEAALGWSKIYGRIAIAQGILIIVAVVATVAITVPHSLVAFIGMLK